MRRLALLAALALTLIACQPLGSNGGYTPVKSWEFNDDGVLPAEFHTGWLAGGITKPVQDGKLACYDPARVKAAGGNLVLSSTVQTTTCGGKSRPYRSGMVETHGRWSWTHGRIEARIWTESCGGQVCDWPAFWTDGEHWPDDGELDIFEGLGGKGACNWHAAGGAGNCGYYDATPGWHTYSAEWEGSCVVSYLDGARRGQWCSGVVHRPHFLILGLQIGPYGGPRKVPGTMLVDYVRVWT